MVYSFTQISQYLACPWRYRHRYLDGWQEKDSRAGMLFGRAFEKALAAYFRREDAAAAFFTEWSAYRDGELVYSSNNSWDRLLQEGFQLLDRFAQEDRVRIPRAPAQPADQVCPPNSRRKRVRCIYRRHRAGGWNGVPD